MNDLDEPNYREQLNKAVQRAIELGAGDLREVCALCQGANPTNVEQLLREAELLDATGAKLRDKKTTAREKAAKARAIAANYLSSIPAANPEISQWWFTLSGIEKLAEQIFLRTSSQRLLLLGASTLGPYYRARFDAECVIMDIDPDLVSAANSDIFKLGALAYDAAVPLPDAVALNSFPL